MAFQAKPARKLHSNGAENNLHPDRPFLVQLRDVGVTYDEGRTWAVRHVNLTIRAGEYVALTGPNGSGKTTLARIVSGLLTPDEGSVTLMGHLVADNGTPHPHAYRLARRQIGTVFQDPQDQILTTRTAEEVAFGPEDLAIPSRLLPGRVSAALKEADLQGFDNTNPGQISGGLQQRVAIASLLAMHPRLLVLDEPTAMLDRSSATRVLHVLDRLHQKGTAILLISHKESVIRKATRIIRLAPSGQRESSQAISLPTPHKRSAISQSSATLQKRSVTSQKRSIPSAHRNSSPAAASGSVAASSRTFHRNQPAPIVLAAQHLSYRYNPHEPWVLRDVNLTLRQGQILALRGPNGSGKSTLVHLLALLEKPTDGTIRLGSTLLTAKAHIPRKNLKQLRSSIGFAMQHPQRQLFASNVREEVAFGPCNLLPYLSGSERSRLVESTLRLLGIENLADRSPFALSGGQQRLVALADALACRPRLLLLDEPSVGLDASSLHRLHRALRACASAGTAILIITHSDHEVRALCAHCLEMSAINHAQKQADVTGHEDVTAHADVMAQALTFQSTPPQHGFLSHTDPRSTILLTFAVMVCLFAVHTPFQLLAALAGAGLFLAIAHVSPRRLLRALHPLLIVLMLLALVNLCVVREGRVLLQCGMLGITSGGVWAACLYSLRLLVILLIGAAVVGAVSPTRLADGFAGLLHPLRRLGVHTQEIGLVLTLALRFLPLIADEAHDIGLAQAARGGDIASGSPARRFHAMMALFVPVFAACGRHAQTTGLALDARCYEEGITRTHLVPLRLSWRDGVFALGVAVFIALIIALGMI